LFEANGYRIPSEIGTLDLTEFEQLAASAKTADDSTAVVLLRQALELWRGPALADVTPELAQLAGPALAERHLAIVERWAELELNLGRHKQIVGELRALVAEHPARERLRELLMRALACSGERSDALAVYEEGRRWLADELSIDPGADLQRLHESILRDDLQASPQPPCSLPHDVRDFSGRSQETDRIVTASVPAVNSTAMVIVAVNGMAGVGKTALAVHAAHLLANRFPDGQLFIDLHGHAADREPREPATALDSLLRLINVPPEEIPIEMAARAARWRNETAGRRLLVVLDDATGAAQIRPLLPGTAGCMVLVTSRNRIAGIDGADILSLDTLGPADAKHLFAHVAGARVAQSGDVDRVIGQCGHLPLAIRIAAARLANRPAWSVGDLAARLGREDRCLAELTVEERSVASVFALSYRNLTTAQRRLYRLLGLHPGTDTDTDAAAALAGLGRGETECLLEDLLDANLLMQQHPGRYRFHDLIRQHAIAMAIADEPAVDRDLAIGRALDFYLHTSAIAMAVFDPTEPRVEPDIDHVPLDVPELRDAEAGARWLEQERPNLVHAIHSSRGLHAWQLPHLIRDFLHHQAYYADWVSTHEHARDVTRRLGDDRAEAITMLGLGFVYHRLGRAEDAIGCYRRAIDLGDALDKAQYATGVNNLGYVYWTHGRFREALALHRQARSLFAAAGHLGGEAYTLFCIGHVLAVLGEHDEVIANYQRSLELNRRAGRRYGEAVLHTELGTAYARVGLLEDARRHLRRSLRLSREIRFRWGELGALRGLGRLHSRTSRYTDALTCYQQALQLAESINDWNHQPGMLNELGRTHRAIGDPAPSLACHQRALLLARSVNSQLDIARALEAIGTLADDRGDIDTARDHWQQALNIYTRLDLPTADRVRALLDGQPTQGIGKRTASQP
jgi:tetratricopeptide (TPR) repeat protein